MYTRNLVAAGSKINAADLYLKRRSAASLFKQFVIAVAYRQ